MVLSQAVSEALERILGAGRVKVQEAGVWLATLEGFQYEVRRQGDAPLLHLWAEEHSLVRRVLRITEESPGRLALEVLRLGRTRPDCLEFLSQERGGNNKRAGRERFRARFHELLTQQFPDEKPVSLTTAAKLQHSLSGNYVRGLLTADSSRWAVLGAAPGESGATYDALLTFGLLWFDQARQSLGRRPIAGLRLFLPQGAGATTAHRLQALSPSTVVELYEFNTENWRARRLDLRDAGNLDTWLVPLRETESVLARVGADIKRIRSLAPEAIEPQVVPGTREVALRFRGLPFARSTPEGMFYGLGDTQLPLTPDREQELTELVDELAKRRSPLATNTKHPLYRSQAERWMQSLVAADPARIEARLDPRFLYSQVPASAAGDRGVLDLLGVTRDGRLAVLELKASEDPHLVLQGVDYWLRVRRHQLGEDFQRYGYFPGISLNPRPPLLFLVAPSLHFHPATDVLLQFLTGEIECIRVGVSESWRRGLKVVLRQGRKSG